MKKFIQFIMSETLLGKIKNPEMGCGAGRLYFHFSSRGEDIQGFDFSAEGIKAIKKVDPDAAVQKADIRKLPYGNETFDVLFSFGLYHNFESLDDKKPF